jgi:magnesium-transporting ATPase (P-type)
MGSPTDTNFILQGFQRLQNTNNILLGLSVGSLGVFHILSAHYPQLKPLVSKRKCLLKDADTVVIYADNEIAVVPVKTIAEIPNFRYFEFRRQRYVFQESNFTLQESIFTGSCVDVHEATMSAMDAQFFRKKHGLNVIDIKVPPLKAMLTQRLVQPFYLFQLFSIFIWIYTGYLTFSLVILLSTIASIAHEIYLHRRSITDLKKMLPKSANNRYSCIRDGEEFKLGAQEMVVGDVVILNHATQVPCDIALIKGECIVDESSMTGEAIPSVKTSLLKDSRPFTVDRFKSSVVFKGTRILQAKNPTGGDVVGVVVATGSSSSMGQLFTSLLHPKKLVSSFLIPLTFFLEFQVL